jgi:hypothetical protein
MNPAGRPNKRLHSVVLKRLQTNAFERTHHARPRDDHHRLLGPLGREAGLFFSPVSRSNGHVRAPA